jgi:hypothetical protein
MGVIHGHLVSQPVAIGFHAAVGWLQRSVEELYAVNAI